MSLTLTRRLLTGPNIAQNVVDAAETFPAVWTRYQAFLKTHDLPDNPSSSIFLTCGNWDLRTMLPAQLDISRVEPTPDSSGNLPAPFDRWINVKDSFRRYYKRRHASSMTGMMTVLRLELEGRHHSGIDDCRNILKIVRKMRSDGWIPAQDV